MSLDARYILSYDNLPYVETSPIVKDMSYLNDKFGGEFIIFDSGNSVFWDKPKYTLSPEDIENLMADQVLEKKDCELWSILK